MLARAKQTRFLIGGRGASILTALDVSGPELIAKIGSIGNARNIINSIQFARAVAGCDELKRFAYLRDLTFSKHALGRLKMNRLTGLDLNAFS